MKNHTYYFRLLVLLPMFLVSIHASKKRPSLEKITYVMVINPTWDCTAVACYMAGGVAVTGVTTTLDTSAKTSCLNPLAGAFVGICGIFGTAYVTTCTYNYIYKSCLLIEKEDKLKNAGRHS